MNASDTWSLPGYDLCDLLGFGGTGEVWRAVELATGDAVALKRLRPGTGPAAVEALRREAAVLRALESPHVVRLREVADTAAGPVLVLDLAEGGSLAALLTRRGTLDPAEVVTVAAPLAQALAAVHDRGLVHGDVTPANVLFTGDGRPLLADLGVARLTGRLEATAEYLDPVVARGGDLSPAADVWALGAVCHAMLAGAPPHEGAAVDDVLAAARSGGRAPLGLLAPAAPRLLVEAVEAALHADPARRPDAAELASRLRRAHGVAPVRLAGPRASVAGPAIRPTHAVPRHAAQRAPSSGHRLPRHVVVGVVAVVLLAGAAGTGWALGAGGQADRAAVLPATPTPVGSRDGTPPPPSAGPRGSPDDWPAVLGALDAERSAALAAADPTRLEAVYAPGSPALAADAAAVRRLLDAGQRAAVVRHTVRSVGELARSDTSARLHVVDVLAPYEVLAADGSVVRREPGRGERSFTVELARTAAGWRLVSLTPV